MFSARIRKKIIVNTAVQFSNSTAQDLQNNQTEQTLKTLTSLYVSWDNPNTTRILCTR